MKATVLGCGLVGSLIIRDLAQQGLEVVAVDADGSKADQFDGEDSVHFEQADLSEAKAIERVISDADVVVGAVPGRLGLEMLRTVISCGKPIADISFAPENAMELDELAKERGSTAVIDAGVSPGLSNLAVGRADAMLDRIEHATIYVGGLPVVRKWPWEYRSVFSPTDVIEEYLRPARMVENGRIVTKPALSEVEPVEIEELGTLEAFNTDGLRTLLYTTEAKTMREKTLRYPGHADRMRALRESGFFSSDPIEVSAQRVVPREVTERLLFDEWKRPEGEREITILRVIVEGDAGGIPTRCSFSLTDHTDLDRGDTSMARTTGYPCAIIAGMLAAGTVRNPGVSPLEKLGHDEEIYRTIIEELQRRGVRLEMTTEAMEDTN